MFLLAIIGILVMAYFIIYFIGISKESIKYAKPKSKIFYNLIENVDLSGLTDKQKQVIQYLQDFGASEENNILYASSSSKSVLTALIKKKVIMRYLDTSQLKVTLVKFIIQVVIITLSMYAANYYFLVKLNLRYFGIFFYLGLLGLLIYNMVSIFKGTNNKKRLFINSVSIASIIVFFFVFIIFGGRPFMFAKDYSELIEVSEADFLTDIHTVDVDTLPLVDKAYGKKLGSLKLGEYPGIGSEFEAGEYSDIIYKGEQYLVAPLEYRGFFKWISNRSVGTPGYILINKVTAETKFINLRETTGKGMLYTPSAFLNQDLVRHAYYEGLNKYKLENQFFEIDDDGNPYYVLQYSLPTIFINGGDKINRIAVVDALTGETNVYLPGNEPTWVESVYPNSLIFNQLDYWGSLQDGWLNSIFAQKGVLQPSSGTRVIMNEGELYYFTGLTSAGSDESTVGFVYAGMKTKETRLFRFPGATEAAAMNKVVTLLPQNNISTSFPIPINVQDTPTYFILIKGEDGRILRYVYISVQDLELWSMSEIQETAYDNYLFKLSENDNASTTNISGTITDISSYVTNGNTIYWVEIDNQDRYKINVSTFSDKELGYFTSLNIGDTISFNVMGYVVITIDIE